jgi:hypothetical protein
MTQASATSTKSIREMEKAAVEFERNRINFLVSAMGLSQGRAYFFDLLEFCQSFVITPSFETNRDYTALGQRNVGMRIFAEIMLHCPATYTTMMEEANARDLVAAARQRSVQQSPGWNDPGSELDPVDDWDPIRDRGDA